MKTIDQLTSRELEIELLTRKLARGCVIIGHLELHLKIAREKQEGRVRELAVQETLLKQTTNHRPRTTD